MHRLLKINNDSLLCKGDNSFRIEDITEKSVIGAVSMINGNQKKVPTVDFIEASLGIGKLFICESYNVDATMRRTAYKEYQKNYLC